MAAGAMLAAVATLWPTAAAGAAAPVIAAAGDIACAPSDPVTPTTCRQTATSNVFVGNPAITAVLPLGDEQYESGLLSEFQGAYDPSWGRALAKTHPVPGNHEYASGSNGVGYFAYFGSRAGNPSKGWYSYHVGTWHLIALNSNCTHVGGCGPSSPQVTWLKNDLAAHHPACTLAYWHHARFSSGPNGNLPDYDAIWKVLYSHHVDVVLSGHDHIYERYALQTPAQARDPKRGIREFVVGTGGRSLDAFTGPFTNGQFRERTQFGVLKLTLHPKKYEWHFVNTAKHVLDSGETACH
jgi:calcineurin-like phosphoesterase family protein